MSNKKEERSTLRLKYETLEDWIRLLKLGKSDQVIKAIESRLRATQKIRSQPIVEKTIIDITVKAEEFKKELLEKETEAEFYFRKLLSLLQLDFECQKIFYYNEGKNFFIVDFFVPISNTVVEIDGEYHSRDKEQRDYDRERTKILKEKYNVKVVRIKNSIVLGDTIPKKFWKQIQSLYK